MALTTEIALRLVPSLTNDLDMGQAKYAPTISKDFSWLSGSGLDQANQLFTDQRTVNASSNDDLDLYGGLTNALGQTINFARIKLLMIFAAVANPGNLQVGGAASNQLANVFGNVADYLILRPGGLLLLTAPDATAYEVTTGTGDIFRVGNLSGAGAAVYDIAIIGATS